MEPNDDIYDIARQMLTNMANVMSKKSDTCYVCGGKINTLEQIGKCVYAFPCGCRLWQGSVPDAWNER